MPVEYLRKTLSIVSANDSDPTATAWFPLNQYAQPFNVSFGVSASETTPYWNIQHTFDDVQDPSITPSVFDHIGGVSADAATTAKFDGNYAFPVAAVRLALISAATGVSGAVCAMAWFRQTGL